MQAGVAVTAVRALATVHDFAMLNGLAIRRLPKWPYSWLRRKLIVALATKLREGQRRAGDGARRNFEYEF